MAEELRVVLGNRDAFHTEQQTHPEGDTTVVRVPLKGKSCTDVRFPPGIPLMEAAISITHAQGVWAANSNGQPAWVASTSPPLATLLAEHYGCPVRDLENPQPVTLERAE